MLSAPWVSFALVERADRKSPEKDGSIEAENASPPRPSAADLAAGSLDLVQAVFGHLRAAGVSSDEDELLAYGQQGLLEAAERFDPERGEDFRRFAYFRVRGAMLDGLRKMGSWSRRGYERVQLLRHAHEVAQSAAEESPQASALDAEQAAERLRQHMAQMATAMVVGVFAEAAFDGTEFTSRDPARSVEEVLGDRQIIGLLHVAITELPPAEAEVVRRHYLQGQCLDDVARDWGCSRSWASRVLTRALKRLGTRLRSLK